MSPTCGIGFFADDGSAHDCTLADGHTGPHKAVIVTHETRSVIFVEASGGPA